MDFTTAARQMENCVVGIVQKFHFSNDPIPTFLGTGFFVSEQGVVATCHHVVDACLKLPVPDGYDPEKDGMPLAVVCWRETVVDGKKQWGWFQLDVVDLGQGSFVGGRPHYVEETQPDLAFLFLNVRDTPTVRFADTPPAIGEPVAFSGYPMGLRTLLGHRGFRQESPTLHAGVVAAINPNRVVESPYHFLVHANTQGGASGSPAFRADGSVVGMVYIVIPEYYEDRNVVYAVPTALTGCIYGPLIAQSVRGAAAKAAEMKDRPRYEDALKNAKIHHAEPDEGVMEPYVPPNDRHR
jgi:hypothetical protein